MKQQAVICRFIQFSIGMVGTDNLYVYKCLAAVCQLFIKSSQSLDQTMSRGQAATSQCYIWYIQILLKIERCFEPVMAEGLSGDLDAHIRCYFDKTTCGLKNLDQSLINLSK